MVCMKITPTRLLGMYCLSMLVWMGSVAAYADEAATANHKLKTYSGTITYVDPTEKTVTVKRFLFTKTFNLAENCALSVGDKNDAALEDLRPGQAVEVAYKNAGGVPVANRIVQKKLRYTGSVLSIDPEKHKLTVSRRGFSKTFSIPSDCKVVLKDDKSGSIENVKVGQTITVVYETPNDSLVARQIEHTSATFVGTLEAIDASARVVKAKHVVGEKKFNLSGDCKIVINGKSNASLSDLRLGQKLVLDYDDVDGVNVVNRIALSEGSAETAQSEETKGRAQK